jgi:uncharacterized protein
MANAPARYPGLASIDSYGNGGFRFADMSHRGSILCLPSGIYAWEPADPATLQLSDLDAVLAEKDRIAFLLLGTGRRQVFAPAPLRHALAAAGIAVETMDTGAACRTFNLLLAERRQVAAGLIAIG